MAHSGPHKSPFKPSLQLLAKLGSIVVHADEATSKDVHEFDVVSIRQLLDDPEVKAWLEAMGALIPKKRVTA